MIEIGSMSAPPSRPARPARPGRAAGVAAGSAEGGFRLPDAAESGEASVGPLADSAGAEPAARIALTGLLAAQEAADARLDAVRDRDARRRGRALLDGLAGLQRRMLAGTLDAESLRALAMQCDEAAEAAADAGLRDILAEICLRVRVELARFGR